MDKELTHHGIKGQKWGVRRFQDYRGNKKIKKLSSKIDEDQSKISELQKRRTKYAQQSVKYQAKGEKINTSIPFGWDIQTARRNKAYVKSGKHEAKANRLDQRVQELENNIKKNNDRIRKINDRIMDRPIKSLETRGIENGKAFLKV